jgi:hypothetical protein
MLKAGAHGVGGTERKPNIAHGAAQVCLVRHSGPVYAPVTSARRIHTAGLSTPPTVLWRFSFRNGTIPRTNRTRDSHLDYGGAVALGTGHYRNLPLARAPGGLKGTPQGRLHISKDPPQHDPCCTLMVRLCW